MAARPRRDPAAERRELERLREVPQRQAVRRGAAPRARAVARPPGCARRASRGRSRRPGPARGGRCSRAAVRRRRRRLHAADDRGAAALGDRGDVLVAAPRERGDRRARRGGIATMSGGCEKSRCRPRTRRGRTCRRCGRRASSGIDRCRMGRATGRRHTGRAEIDLVEGAEDRARRAAHRARGDRLPSFAVLAGEAPRPRRPSPRTGASVSGHASRLRRRSGARACRRRPGGARRCRPTG